mmetsp:Transcript_19793/g.35299  ORF Transcript_19793/g.35299 Transcript_19793/m.35299 type:complete len:92 (+) Transcript_19793:366-641(+)
MFPLIGLWAVKIVFAVALVHVNVSTRFLGTVPCFYWQLAEAAHVAATSAEPATRQVEKSGFGLVIPGLILLWVAIYFVLGPMLFCTFLPWT